MDINNNSHVYVVFFSFILQKIMIMSMNRWYGQFMILFGGIMAFFYVGVGFFIIFSTNLDHLDKVLRNLGGGAFVLYGLFRLYKSIEKIREEFFSDKYDSD